MTSTGLGETETPVLEDTNKTLCVPRLRGKEQLLNRKPNQNYLLMSEGLLWRHGTQGQVMVGVSSLGGCHKPDQTAHIPEGRVASGQKITREGVQTHPSADNWIKALVSKALPTRTRTSFSHHQSLLPGRLSKPHSLLHERAGRGCKKNNNPTVTKTKPHCIKLISMKKQKVTSQME